MRPFPLALLSACLLIPVTATAEVMAAGRHGFSLRIETVSQASVEVSYQAFMAVERWWDVAHSYSGDAGNLSLSAAPGGAFLEKLDNGGFVRHLEVVYVNPGKEIRLLGGLGPLQPMGLDGAMSVQFQPFGKGSKTIMTYNVSGFSPQGLQELAPVVDRVQAGQMQRHAGYADLLWLERAGE